MGETERRAEVEVPQRTLALLLPCLPALAGLLYRRWMGWYVAAALAVVTLVAGLAAGQAAMGLVYIGGDEQPLMESEIMTMARDCLFPPDADEWLESSGKATGGRPGGFIAALLMWLLGGWGFVWLLAGYGVVAEGLLPRFTPPLPAQAILWAAVGGAVAWAAWALARRAVRRWLFWTVVVALCGVALTVTGHAALSQASGIPSLSSSKVLARTFLSSRQQRVRESGVPSAAARRVVEPRRSGARGAARAHGPSPYCRRRYCCFFRCLAFCLRSWRIRSPSAFSACTRSASSFRRCSGVYPLISSPQASQRRRSLCACFQSK